MSIHRPTSPISQTPTEKPSEGLSPQARQAIAIGGLLACLLIGAGIIYFFLASPSRRTVTVDPKAQTQDFSGMPPGMRGGGGQGPRRQQMTIAELDPNTWQALGKTSAMRIKKQSDNSLKVSLFYFSRDFASQDQIALISGLVRAQRDDAMAKQWGLSPDQVEQLKKVSIGGPLMVVSDKEHDEMLQLATAYVDAGGANKADAEKKLLTRLEDLGKAKLDASRQAYIERLDAAKKILTPDQLQKMTTR